ncbi:ribosome-associated protein [Rhizomicrobium palustre]|uniref:Ribosome-associated protein n=1 Tax=Rhizomicrobium palustre TaxID=189966 RepID=A0A846N5D0_9PROT|nr:alternative ribosome rescue aminoacyl-tRNA hydrolase ArfB [Rhizomicrobium palustre]NIK90382.1 ribosome-associated protein [Rhizomicrobium palustre]
MAGIRITDEIALDEREVEESFVLASGPGGQNVNKVSSAVQLRFNVALSLSLPEPVRYRLMTQLKSRLTNGGELILVGRKFRDQNRNREDVRARLVEIIKAATVEPKKRFKTRPPRGAVEDRLKDKKKQAARKQGRGRFRDE